MTAGAWLKHLIPDLPVLVSPVAVSVNYWDIDPTKLQHFQPENGCPVMIITDHCEELYAIPAVDYPNKFKVGYDKMAALLIDGGPSLDTTSVCP